MKHKKYDHAALMRTVYAWFVQLRIGYIVIPILLSFDILIIFYQERPLLAND
jgi:hypothetical protein